jgi:hypothetical protein
MARSGVVSGNIVHTIGARYKARGSGLLRTRLYNMGYVDDLSLKFSNLDPIELGVRKNREKMALANFQDQGIQIWFRTIHIDETLNISKIILFVKPVAESYPITTGGG